MVSFAKALEIESWTLYPIGLLLIAARLVSRRMLRGSWRRLGIDDWLMILAVFTYTTVIVCVNQVATNQSNYLLPGQYEEMSPADVKNAVFGSKMVFVMEMCMLANTWLCKACLLFVLHYLTLGTKVNKAIMWVAAYCAVGYLTVNILFLGVWCRPITQYWRVPVENQQCANYYNQIITSAVFNISSDILILCVPVPVLIKLQLPLKRKIILGTVFSLGILTVLTAVLNRYYNFSSPYGSLDYLYWYAAESSTSIYVANIPLCWPVLRKFFALDPFSAAGRTKGSANVSSGNHYSSKVNTLRGDRPMGRAEDGWQRTDSEERIVGNFNNGATPWNANDVGTAHGGEDSQTGDVELGDVALGHKAGGYVTSSVAGPDEKKDTDWHRREASNIVKTVDIDQYSSTSRSPG